MQADPLERANEALPLSLDPGQQEGGRASSDGEADARPNKAMNGSANGVSQTSKSQQGRLARHHIADQDHDKIDKVILTEAYTSKAYLVLDFFQDPCMSQHLSKGGHFSQPGWG